MGQLSPINLMPDDWLTTYEQVVLNVKCYAEIWSGLNPTDPDSNVLLLGNIPVVSGSVTIDRNNVNRRTATDVTLLLDNAGELLPIANTGDGWYAPYGYEVHLYKGCVAPSGIEYAQLGVFLIEEVDVKDDGSGVTLVGTLNDRGEWISRRGFWEPFGLLGGISTATEMIAAILLFCVTSAYTVFTEIPWPESFTATTYKPPTVNYDIGDDPWQECQNLAASAGMQLYFDYAGTLVLEPVPNPNSITPCVAYVEGTSIAPVELARAISNKNVPNVICVTSQGSGVATTVRVWWWDDNPDSVTYYAPAPAGGFIPTNPQYVLPPPADDAKYPFLIQRFDSSLIGPTFQVEQAVAVAIAIGLTSIGSLEGATFTLRDQPAHDVDDVITVQRVVAGIPEGTNYIVDQVQIDLSVSTALSLTTRLVLAS